MSKPKQPKALTQRQRIAHIVLQERLGLNYEWLDPEAICPLPKEIPTGTLSITPSAKWEVGRYIRELANLGCRKEVLYWCLSQTGRDVEARMGQGPLIMSEANSDGEIESYPRPEGLPTRAEMMRLVSAVNQASKMLHRYQSELLICARLMGDNHQWPSGPFEQDSHDSLTSIAIAKSAMGWLRAIAQSWETPNLKVLLKSTSTLYLLCYVWFCSNVLPLQRENTKGRRNPSRLASQHAATISLLVSNYCNIDISAIDLNDKLQDFRKQPPELFQDMLSLVRALHYDGVSA